MTLKKEFEQAFNYKIGSAKDDWDSITQRTRRKKMA